MDLAAEFTKRWPNGTYDHTRLAPVEASEHHDDVVLAWACVAGLTEALAELDEKMIVPAVAHARGDADELAQLARVRLLIGDPPALTTYRGRGSLAAFVRTVVTRLALDQHRATRPIENDAIESLIDRVSSDPELAHMRERYAGDLGGALQTAWRNLAPHDRFVLDLELHQHLGIEQIATIYGVHRTSATRKVASARASFVAATREALRQKLAIGDGTLDSILRLMTTSTKWTALAALDEQR